MAHRVAHQIFQRLGQIVEVAGDAGVGGQPARKAAGRPAAFKGGVVDHQVPHRQRRQRFGGGAALLGVVPGQRQRVRDQLAHGGHFPGHAAAQVLLREVPFQGDTEAAQRRAQFVGHVVQQLALAAEHLGHPFGHAVEAPTQVAELVPARRQPRAHPRFRVVLEAPHPGPQQPQGHHGAPVQQAAGEHRQQRRQHHHQQGLPQRPVAPGHKARRQLHHQPPRLRVVGKRHADVGHGGGPEAHAPVQLALEAQAGALALGERPATERMITGVHHHGVAGLTAAQLLQPGRHPLGAAPVPGVLRLGGVLAHHHLGRLVQQHHLLAHGAQQPAAQHHGEHRAQAEQQRQLPEQGMTAGNHGPGVEGSAPAASAASV